MLEVSMGCYDQINRESNTNYRDVELLSLNFQRSHHSFNANGIYLGNGGKYAQSFGDSSECLEPQISSTPETVNPQRAPHTQNSREEKPNYSENSQNFSVNSTKTLDTLSDSSRLQKKFLNCNLHNFETLEVQPSLLDYLVRHRAISEVSYNEILAADEDKRPAMLLSAVGLPLVNGSDVNLTLASPSHHPPPAGLALLLNALRQTGHHELASYLDCSRRITPSSYTVSNESFPMDAYKQSPQRIRGQLCIWIQLLAIKVCPTLYNQFGEKLSNPNESIRNKNNTLLPSYVEALKNPNDPYRTHSSLDSSKPSSVPFWIDHTSVHRSQVLENRVSSHTPETNSSHCNRPNRAKGLRSFLCCLPMIKRKRKIWHPKEYYDHDMPKNLSDNITVQPDNPLNLPRNGAGDCPLDSPIDSNASAIKLAILDKKSAEFYDNVIDANSPLRDALIKYLEQSSGVLVLDCKLGQLKRGLPSSQGSVNSIPALQIIITATQSELIKRLSEACSSYPIDLEPIYPKSRKTALSSSNKSDQNTFMLTSKLADDLTKVFIQAGILERLEIQNLRLSISLDQNEVEQAITELIDRED